MKKTAPELAVDSLDDIIALWEKNADFTLGPNLTLKNLKDTRKGLDDSVKEVKSLKRQITEQTDTRDDLTKLAKNHIVRARKGVLAHFGTDSTEYALVGGTRASERKRPGRKSGSTNAKKAA